MADRRDDFETTGEFAPSGQENIPSDAAVLSFLLNGRDLRDHLARYPSVPRSNDRRQAPRQTRQSVGLSDLARLLTVDSPGEGLLVADTHDPEPVTPLEEVEIEEPRRLRRITELASNLPLAYVYDGIRPDPESPSFQTFLPRLAGLAEERMCLTLVWAALQGSTTFGAIANVVKEATPGEQPDKEFADKLSALVERRLVTNGLVRVSSDSSNMRRLEVSITDTGMDFAPLASSLLYLSSKFGKDISLSQLFHFSVADNIEAVGGRLSLLRTIAQSPAGRLPALTESGVPESSRTRFLRHLVNARLLVAIPGFSVGPELMPEYTQGLRSIGNGIASALEKKLSSELIALFDREDGAVFNPYTFLHSGDNLRRLSEGDPYAEVMLYLEYLRRNLQLTEVRPSQVKFLSVIPTPIGKTLIAELIDIVDGHMADDEKLRIHAAEVFDRMTNGSKPEIGRLTLGETIKKSA